LDIWPSKAAFFGTISTIAQWPGLNHASSKSPKLLDYFRTFRTVWDLLYFEDFWGLFWTSEAVLGSTAAAIKGGLFGTISTIAQWPGLNHASSKNPKYFEDIWDCLGLFGLFVF
jgi:hypothetical protein